MLRQKLLSVGESAIYRGRARNYKSCLRTVWYEGIFSIPDIHLFLIVNSNLVHLLLTNAAREGDIRLVRAVMHFCCHKAPAIQAAAQGHFWKIMLLLRKWWNHVCSCKSIWHEDIGRLTAERAIYAAGALVGDTMITKVAQKLSPGCLQNLHHAEWMLLLSYALAGGNLSIVRPLVQYSVPSSYVVLSIDSIIAWAIEKKSVRLVRFALERDALFGYRANRSLALSNAKHCRHPKISRLVREYFSV